MPAAPVQDKLKIAMDNSDKLGKRVVESEQARTLLEGKLVAAERKAAILQQKLGQGGQVGRSTRQCLPAGVAV